MDKPIALICITLALPLLVWSQGAPQATSAGGLKIVVIEGENAVNNLTMRSAVQPMVEVRDENDRPVAGAEVEFALPLQGPSGIFDSMVRRQTVKTDAQGRARAHDMAPNDQPGLFKITVTANSGGKTGAASIAQSNAMNGGKSQSSVKKSNKKLYIVLGVVAVGAIVAGVAIANSGSSTTTTVTTPVSIGAGPITVGGPR